jgi:heterodisulfide reductase subunit A2
VKTHNPQVLIVGGGIAGITAAAALGRLDISVALFEKGSALGGKVRHFCCKATQTCQQCGACLLNDTLAALSQRRTVEVSFQTKLTEIHWKTKEFLYTYSRPEGGGEGRAPALLLATGFTPFRAEDKPQHRYGILPNVLTGFDLERILQETGTILRPSDRTSPRSIAFIQCVGSRDLHLNHPFCSQVCCGYALRLANLIRHRCPQTEITVFYMDVQTFGKDFSFFMERTREQVRLIRSIPGEIQGGGKGELLLTYQNPVGAGSRTEAFDLAVLSVGIMPGEDQAFFQDRLGLALNADGFLTQGPGPDSNRSALFLAGTVQGPKSISRSMAQAYSAAEEIAVYLRSEAAP